MRRREFIAGLGGAVAWPLAARAQQRALPVIGYLSGLAENSFPQFEAAFRQGLGEQGYAEGQNVEILYRWAELQYDRLPVLAADLVRLRVAVIAVTIVTSAVEAAKAATTTTPIVFATGADPVELGLVARFNRPGGNATGTTFLNIMSTAKRLELLHEAVPAAMSIGVLVNPTNSVTEHELREAEMAAHLLGVRLVIANATTPGEIESAFEALIKQRVGALLLGLDALLFVRRNQIAALAAHYALPSISAWRESVEAGVLISYGSSISDAWRLAGTYAGRIIKGERPADLPVQQSTRFEMVLNLKTAKALGLSVPTATLLRADEVIE